MTTHAFRSRALFGDIGPTTDGAVIGVPLAFTNRHGLVTGSTGSGKTVTMQRMKEELSSAGVPVFAADVKGDLSGIAIGFPAVLWDIFGRHGLLIRTSVQEMGAGLLSRMLCLDATQEGTMEIAFRKAEDEHAYMLTLDDLRWGRPR